MKKTLLLSVVAAILISCCNESQNVINVVPYPNQVSIKNGTFDALGAEFHYLRNWSRDLLRGSLSFPVVSALRVNARETRDSYSYVTRQCRRRHTS